MADADRLEVRESAAHTRPSVPVLTNALTASAAHLGRVVNVAPIRQSALAQTSVSMANADQRDRLESVALTHQNVWARMSAYKENVSVLAREPVEVRMRV